MNCNICGSSETYLQDGIEYCRECSEQIIGSIDEVASDDSCSRSSLLSSPRRTKTKNEPKILSPWLYFEAYNLILSKQVEALIKLGCSEKLKTVVFCIWAKYLKKCESAFTPSDGGEFIPRLSLFAYKRDVELLYGEGILSHQFKFNRPTKLKICKKQKPKAEVVESEDTSTNEAFDSESQSPSCVDQSNKVLSDDSDMSACEISSDESSIPSLSEGENKVKKEMPNILYSSHAKALKDKGYKGYGNVFKNTVDACVSHMTLAKTLSFCQLGLLYTKDQMLLFDMIRLVNEGAVPFIDVTRHFPTSMQVQATDQDHLTKIAAPNIRLVSYTSARLVEFLQLPKFEEPPLLPIAIRFAKDLNLPCDLIPVLKLLIDKINKNSDEQLKTRRSRKTEGNCPLPFYEARAMSVIAVALKMLFVLNGKFEMEHSEIMMKLNSICEDQKYFVWEEWQKQLALKEYLFIKNYTVNENTMNRLDSLSADRITGGYPIPLIHQELNSNASKNLKAEISRKVDLEQLFKNVIKDSPIGKKPTSFPLKYELHRLMTDWKKMPLYKDTENIDFSFINKDFSHHKLYYRPSAKTDEPTNLLLSSLYESVKLIHITDYDEYYENVIRSSEKYCHYIYTRKPNFEDNFPFSFKWLFNFMCNYLQVDKLDFYKEFRYIEHKLIPGV